MFGPAWTDRHPDRYIPEVKAIWRDSLAGYTDDAMRMAWESMLRDSWKFPPNLSEFAHLCRQFERRGPHRLALPDKRRGPAPPGGFEALRSVLRRV
jgi:hypothetical protein